MGAGRICDRHVPRSITFNPNWFLGWIIEWELVLITKVGWESLSHWSILVIVPSQWWAEDFQSVFLHGPFTILEKHRWMDGGGQGPLFCGGIVLYWWILYIWCPLGTVRRDGRSTSNVTKKLPLLSILYMGVTGTDQEHGWFHSRLHRQPSSMTPVPLGWNIVLNMRMPAIVTYTSFYPDIIWL